MIKKQPNESGNDDSKNRASKQGQTQSAKARSGAEVTRETLARVFDLVADVYPIGLNEDEIMAALHGEGRTLEVRELLEALRQRVWDGWFETYFDGQPHWKVSKCAAVSLDLPRPRSHPQALEIAAKEVDLSSAALDQVKIRTVGFFHLIDNILEEERIRAMRKEQAHPRDEAITDAVSMLSVDMADLLAAAIERVEDAARELRCAMEGRRRPARARG